MLLGFDIGNTNTILALYDIYAKPVDTMRFNTEKNAAVESLTEIINSFLAKHRIENIQITTMPLPRKCLA